LTDLQQRKIQNLEVCVQRPTSAVNVTLLAFAAEQRLRPCAAAPLPIDISCPHGAQQQMCANTERWTTKIHNGTSPIYLMVRGIMKWL